MLVIRQMLYDNSVSSVKVYIKYDRQHNFSTCILHVHMYITCTHVIYMCTCTKFRMRETLYFTY